MTLSILTGNPIFDGLGTIAIGALLVVIAIVLAGKMKSLLLGESASPETVRRIEAELEAGPGVERLLEVMTQHLGPDELLVAAKAEFDPSLSVAELAGAIDACEARLRAAVPIAKFVYVEPGPPRE